MIGKLDMTGRTIYENTAIAKLNEVIDVVNRLEEFVQGVVNNSITDGGRILSLQEQIHALKTTMANNANVAENCECAKNAHELVTLTDMFNEMGRLYADLWKRLEQAQRQQTLF